MLSDAPSPPRQSIAIPPKASTMLAKVTHDSRSRYATAIITATIMGYTNSSVDAIDASI